MEDVAHRLYPEFNMIEATKPYAEGLLKRNFSLSTQMRELGYAGLDLLEFVKALPSEGRDVLRQLREGRMRIEFEHLGLEPIRRTIQNVTNRLSLSILIASLIIGSSLMVNSEVPPLVGGASLIGIIGYVFAGLLAIGLIISMMGSGRY
jgi:ubiquinone biosynthesis protein